MDKDRIRAWLVEDALPVWSTEAIDDAGGFVEQLDLSGKAEPGVNRRARVQPRQIYVFCEAMRLGLGDYRELIATAVDWLYAHGFDQAEGGFFHLLDGNGAPVERTKDTYDHAFMMLGLAHASRAAPSAKVTELLEHTIAFVTGKLRASEGPGFAEQIPARQPRRQNPHMHLLEAFLALYEVTGEARFLAEADTIVEMFRAHFFRPETETLAEFFGDDWAPLAGDEGRIVEPGHHFEWVYLLQAHAETHAAEGALTEPPAGAQARGLFEVARARGIDPVSGLAYDSIWQDGGVKARSKRCWVQTEALRTHALMGRSSAPLAGEAAQWLDRLFRYYLEPAPKGTWLDVMDAENQPTPKAIPASTLYHLMSAFSFLLREPAVDVGAARS